MNLESLTSHSHPIEIFGFSVSSVSTHRCLSTQRCKGTTIIVNIYGNNMVVYKVFIQTGCMVITITANFICLFIYEFIFFGASYCAQAYFTYIYMYTFTYIYMRWSPIFCQTLITTCDLRESHIWVPRPLCRFHFPLIYVFPCGQCRVLILSNL